MSSFISKALAKQTPALCEDGSVEASLLSNVLTWLVFGSLG